MLAEQADANAKESTGVTALMIATANGHADVVQVLLLSGANVYASDAHGRNALMLAVGALVKP
jgi:ankyrin repeat protein